MTLVGVVSALYAFNVYFPSYGVVPFTASRWCLRPDLWDSSPSVA